MSEIRVRLLGSVRLQSGPVPAGRVSTLLALLAMEPGRVVSLDRLMDQLWGDDQPGSGPAALHVHVSRLRRHLAGSGIGVVTRLPGYALDAPADAVDTHLFAQRVADSEAAAARGDWATALDTAAAARALWQGSPFADVLPTPDLVAEGERLGRLAARADELRVRALLALGQGADAEQLARSLTARDRLNETYWRLRMRVEHAAGNDAVALASFEEFRSILDEELGVDPGERIRALHLEILQARDAAAEPRRPPLPIPTLVRRIAERHTLAELVDAAVGGGGRVVLLEGEPGVGKTALAGYAAARATEANLLVARARAMDGPGTPPLWMWEQIVGELTADDQSGDPLTGAQQLRALARSSVSAEDGTDRERARFRLSEAIVALVVRSARRRPLLLIFDDVQWADDGTLHALELLAQAVSRYACSVVITARTGPDRTPAVAAALGRINRTDGTRTHRISPFTRAEVAEFLGVATDSTLAGSMLDRTGGNPYFLTEMTKAGVDTAAPVTAIELLQQRTATLPEPTRDVLQLAAVAGRRLDIAVLAACLSRSPVQTVDRLGPAVEIGLIGREAVTEKWGFSHDLGRQAVLDAIAPPSLALLHAQLADAIAVVHADDPDDHLDELAHHRFEAVGGGPSAAAFAACMAAADHAVERLSFDQAALQRSRALMTLEPGPEHRSTRFEVLMALTVERRLSGDVIGAATSLRQAIALARRLGDRVLLTRAVAVFGGVTLWNWRQFEQVDRETIALLEELLADGGEPQPTTAQRAELLGTLAVELYYGDERATGELLADQAADLARQTGDAGLIGRALNNLVIAKWSPGHDESRMRALDESLALAGHGLPLATEAIARMHRAALRLRRADVNGFERDLDRATWLAPRIGLPEIKAQVISQQAGLALLRDDLDSARELIHQSYDQMSRTSLWGAEWVRLVQLTSLARLQGRLADLAEPLLARASEDAYRPLRWTAVLVLAELGEIRRALAMQARWGLRGLSRRTHWGSQFEWAQAAEIALLLDAPSLDDIYAALLPAAGELIDVGTALAVWGTVDDLLARLAARLGRNDLARTHAATAAAVTERVAAALGGRPSWSVD